MKQPGCRSSRAGAAPTPEPPLCPSSLSASSAPLLLRLAHRRESKLLRLPSASTLALSIVALLIAAFIASPPTASAQGRFNARCPASCICFFTLMYCSNIREIPSSIPNGVRYAYILGSTFNNPVLRSSNFTSGYQNVIDIAIQYTNLNRIEHRALDNLRRVRYISLDHNRLREMPSSMLRVMARARFVSLFSNPWHCNRNLAWLYEVYRSQPDRFGSGCLDPDCRHVSQVRCSSPAVFQGLDFVNITFTQYQRMQQTA